MQFKIQLFPNGQVSIYDPHFKESMHSWIGPWQEAHQIYLVPSELANLLTKNTDAPLVIYDMGLGIATHAIAAIEIFLQVSSSQSVRNLHIISFEKNMSGLACALENESHFPFISRRKSLIQELLKSNTLIKKNSNGSQFKWDLIIGDFKEHLNLEDSPELIFYDFYSPKTCPELWNLETFQLLFHTTASRRHLGQESNFFTYTSSTSVRSALLLAGFFVGYGISTEAKKETTIASTQLKNISHPLGHEWLEHWHRSSKPFPQDATQVEYKNILIQKVSEQVLNGH